MMLRLLPLFATLLARTLRVRWNGALPKRSIVMFWHGKMLAGWWCVSRGQDDRGQDDRATRTIALVSKSKDGQILSSVLTHWKYQLARGSTKKGGMEALEEAIARLRNNDVDLLAITPDGPTGPLHIFKRGGFIAARETGLPLVMLRIHYTNAIRLKSWDTFEIPLPFSRVEISVEDIMMPPNLDETTLAALSRPFDA